MSNLSELKPIVSKIPIISLNGPKRVSTQTSTNFFSMGTYMNFTWFCPWIKRKKKSKYWAIPFSLSFLVFGYPFPLSKPKWSYRKKEGLLSNITNLYLFDLKMPLSLLLSEEDWRRKAFAREWKRKQKEF